VNRRKNKRSQSKAHKSIITTMSETKKESESVEVTWAGKKLVLEKEMLDKWYDNSFESRDFYVKEHPWVKQAIPLHKFSKPGEEKPEIDMSKFVVVHFGGKSLLLQREQLDAWYAESPEDRAEFVKDHPEAEIKFH